MSRQKLPDLSLQAAETIAAHKHGVAAQTRKRQLVLGVSGLMLMGVAVFATTGRSSQANSASQLASFTPGFKPGVQTKGLRSFANTPVYMGQSINDGGRAGDPQATMATGLAAAAAGGREQATRIAMALTKSIAIANPMSRVAATALDSNKDASQLASVFAVLPEEDKAIVEDIKVRVKDKAQTMAGVSAPLGFFDPLAFCADGGPPWVNMNEGKLCFYREAELKHGRLGMLASVGFLVGEQWHPLFGGDVDVPSYLAFQQTPLQQFWPAVVAAIAITEVFSVKAFKPPKDENGKKQYWEVRSDRVPGDLGFDPLGTKPKDPEKLKKMQTKELNNGRLAMLAAAGMVAQELVTGEKLF
jgi:hypothetical protein